MINFYPRVHMGNMLQAHLTLHAAHMVTGLVECCPSFVASLSCFSESQTYVVLLHKLLDPLLISVRTCIICSFFSPKFATGYYLSPHALASGFDPQSVWL